MTTKLDKPKTKLTIKDKVKNKLKELGYSLSEGDMLIDSDGRIYKVGKITNARGLELLQEDNDGTWNCYSHYKEHNEWIFFSKYIKLEKSYDDYIKELSDNLSDTAKYSDNDTTESKSTELTTRNDPKQLVALKSSIEAKKQHMQILSAILERKRNELSYYVRDMEKKIQKVQKVIDIIELYLGIHETIIQIQEGNPASSDEPITFRQMVLFMDEEVGDPADQGIDFQKIEQFDEWLLKPEHYKKIIPEEKCVVIMKPRRHSKNYGCDWFTNAIMNAENKRTYILIRNGQNFYRIDSNIVIDKRLFPEQGELERLFKDYKEDSWEYGKEREKIEDTVMSYKRNALMMQGLIERTKVFFPMSNTKLNMFEPETYGNSIRFIHDAEMTLGDGRQRFEDRKKEINNKIIRGTRVIFSGFSYETKNNSTWNFPVTVDTLPGSGLYTVEEVILPTGEYGNKYEKLRCMYFQGGERSTGWSWNYVERKNKTSFYLYRDDYNVINYDLITLDDVEFYLDCRLDRENYLRMIPILWEIKKQRIEELKWEKGFVENLKLRLGCEEKVIWSAIDWWKKKVIWKRPIMKDDAKALRMIEKRLKQHTLV